MSAIYAPAGWGWPPGYPLTPVSEADLPDVSVPGDLTSFQRNKVIAEALHALPFIREVRPCHVKKRYGLSDTTATDVLDRAKGRSFAKFGATRYPEKAA